MQSETSTITTRFALAEADPHDSPTYVVHLQPPRFVAPVVVKLRWAGPESPAGPLGGIDNIRGLNLYPCFMNDPSFCGAQRLMRLLQDAGRYFLDRSLGDGHGIQLEDAGIVVVFKQQGIVIPPHLAADLSDAPMVIRVEYPKLIIKLMDHGLDAVVWSEDCLADESERAIAKAVQFHRRYIEAAAL